MLRFYVLLFDGFQAESFHTLVGRVNFGRGRTGNEIGERFLSSNKSILIIMELCTATLWLHHVQKKNISLGRE